MSASDLMHPGWPGAENRAVPPPADPPADAAAPPDDAFERRIAPPWRRAHDGDEAAYREALTLAAARLRAYLRRRLAARPDEVEDLVQDTLLALHLHRGTWDPTLPVAAWMLAIARHKLIDHLRRHGRREALHEPLDEVGDERLAAPDAEAGTARDLQRLLQALPAAQRSAIVLTRLEGLSVNEAAQRTGASESAIKVQVHRGLKRLAALVRRTG
ncbi:MULTISPECIES: sigma-70 family RNA polymerase sigma factor [unclassified Rubrivivax]|uniref:sigma-70 family RNA polymerase sigma factor n=1 Tax=unclassified Rubrivivax TaxID=2649762 RepID=UPI001E3DB215|nr:MULTISPECIES: sigma-70 family RNA polymerase sigma factor [unclassified Rubrivivax]MCC9595269.1 sigma-70 family RNA polymerase sigma factor [Rubrivivax sp. JA1055]MCC9647940.1 sigma-70 family RNA polymerase sigma factor [Rubrivivax sp. JA1029]